MCRRRRASSREGLLYPPQEGADILRSNVGRRFGNLQLTVYNGLYLKQKANCLIPVWWTLFPLAATELGA